MQSEIDDIREKIDGQGGETLDRIADTLNELTDLLRYGDAYVKKVGDYDPPKRPAT